MAPLMLTYVERTMYVEAIQRLIENDMLIDLRSVWADAVDHSESGPDWPFQTFETFCEIVDERYLAALISLAEELNKTQQYVPDVVFKKDASDYFLNGNYAERSLNIKVPDQGFVVIPNGDGFQKIQRDGAKFLSSPIKDPGILDALAKLKSVEEEGETLQ